VAGISIKAKVKARAKKKGAVLSTDNIPTTSFVSFLSLRLSLSLIWPNTFWLLNRYLRFLSKNRPCYMIQALIEITPQERATSKYLSPTVKLSNTNFKAP
jgi:hypothetical protein